MKKYITKQKQFRDQFLSKNIFCKFTWIRPRIHFFRPIVVTGNPFASPQTIRICCYWHSPKSTPSESPVCDLTRYRLALEVDRILCYDNGPTIVIGGGPFVALVTPTKVGLSPNYPQESAFDTIFIRRSHTIPHTYAKTTPWQHSRIDIFQADGHKSSWTKSGGINCWARPWWVRGIGLTSNWSGIDKQLRA